MPLVETIKMLLVVAVRAHTPPGTLASSSIFIDFLFTLTTEPSPAPIVSSLGDMARIEDMPFWKILFIGPTRLKFALSRNISRMSPVLVPQ